MYYVEAFQVANGYRGRIYKYRDCGNRTDVVQLTPADNPYPTKESAIDAMVEYCEENNMECEVDFS